MLRYVRGYAAIVITGASPERCLNRFSQVGIAFWELRREDELRLRCRIYRSDLAKAERAALRAMCTVTVEREYGLPVQTAGLRRRPLLVVGVLLAVALAVFAQNFVWVVRIEGNETVSEAALRHALAEEGIGFGTWAESIDSPLLRMRMQLRLPQLQWLAANRSGGVLTVLVAERSEPAALTERSGAANVVASRAGIITSLSALDGTAAVETGDAVESGQLLISGITTWENRSRITHAAGEVYALTSRQGRAVLPESYTEKRYTGETAREISLIFGRSRRKIFGNSRISTMNCDKMITRKVCTLPGGDTFPLTLEIVQYRYYETASAALDESYAQTLLEDFVLRDAKDHMIAGKILETAFQLTKENGCYVLLSELSCEEMISRTVPIFSLGEDEIIGEAD